MKNAIGTAPKTIYRMLISLQKLNVRKMEIFRAYVLRRLQPVVSSSKEYMKISAGANCTDVHGNQKQVVNVRKSRKGNKEKGQNDQTSNENNKLSLAFGMI